LKKEKSKSFGEKNRRTTWKADKRITEEREEHVVESFSLSEIRSKTERKRTIKKKDGEMIFVKNRHRQFAKAECFKEKTGGIIWCDRRNQSKRGYR